MKSVRSLAVAALMIVAAVSAARAFPAYEPLVRDVTEFGSSRSVPARDGTFYWKKLLYPMLKSRSRRDENRNGFKENVSVKQAFGHSDLMVTPPPEPSQLFEKRDGQLAREPIDCYFGSSPGPAFFKVCF